MADLGAKQALELLLRYFKTFGMKEHLLQNPTGGCVLKPNPVYFND